MSVNPTQISVNATDAEISAFYGVSVATVRRWRSDGRRAKRPAPLNNPAEMVEWWGAMAHAGHFVKPCPLSIIETAEKSTGADQSTEEDGAAEFDPSQDGMKEMLRQIQNGELPFDYSDGVKLAERNLQMLDYLLLDAAKKNKVKDIASYRKQFSEASDSYRALMRDRGKIQADADQTLPKEEVRAAMLEIHGNITRQFRQKLRAAFDDVPGKLATREVWNLFIENLVDQICDHFQKTKFAAD